MMSHLEPSVEITGGPWYSENELDTEFIKMLATACLRFIQDKVRLNSWYINYHTLNPFSEPPQVLFLLGNRRPVSFYGPSIPNLEIALLSNVEADSWLAAKDEAERARARR